MTISLGCVPAGSVLPIMFNTFDSNGASITITGLAITDIEIYKGTSMTQRASDAGYVLLDTDGIDLDGITGIQGFSIDLGDNTDAGFYAAGSFYNVVVSAITVDTRTVNFVAATFRIVAAENTAGVPVADTVRVGGGVVPSGAIPNAVAGANGGVVIAGSNAATTFATLTSTGALTTGSIVNNGATTLTGNVTLSGTLGIGATTLASLTVSANLLVSGTSTFTGATTYTGNVGYINGIFVAGGSQLHALRLSAATAGHGIYATGLTTGSGIRADGGATGNGMYLIGGATSGHGLQADAATSGDGMHITGAGGGNGMQIAGDTAGFGSGIASSGYAGMRLQGFEGLHIQTNNTNETAVYIQGGGDTPTGIVVTGGVEITGADTGDALALIAKAASNGNGLSAIADGIGLDITAPVNDLGFSIAGDVWDVTLAAHLSPGSTGEALNAAGAAGDPWITSLPGAYGAGTAGFIVGTNLNATVSSRSTYAGADTPGTTTLLTRIPSAFQFTVPGYADVNIRYVNGVLVNGTGAPGNTWGP